MGTPLRYNDANVYIFMIHKLYVDRLQSHMSQRSPVSSKILDIPKQTGVSQARRGYVVLRISCALPIPTLSPMIRQNIAWAAPISYRISNTTHDDEAAPLNDASIGLLIWNSILCDAIWSNETKSLFDPISLRVDCYPKVAFTEELCRQLQQAVRRMMNDPGDADDPFEGPLPMTMSKSKCTHRLTVVRIESSSNTVSYYWGLESRQSTTKHSPLLMDVPFNHEAAEEIVIVSHTSTTVPTHRPVSRAFYKLHELWQDYIGSDSSTGKIAPQSAAMDLGAAPGGWTQVLLQQESIVSSVVAVDKAQLAPLHRLLRGSAQRLFHVPATLEHFHYRSYLEEANGPAVPTHFAILVCDASVQWNNLLPLILQTLLRNQTVVTWALPAIVVITLKLPFKTIHSIERHILDIEQRVPKFTLDLQATLYPTNLSVTPRYRIIHLMANSDSERTLLIFFEVGTA